MQTAVHCLLRKADRRGNRRIAQFGVTDHNKITIGSALLGGRLRFSTQKVEPNTEGYFLSLGETFEDRGAHGPVELELFANLAA